MIWKRWHGAAREMPPLHWRPLSEVESEDYGSREVDRINTENGKPRRTVAILCCRNGHHCALVLGGDSKFTVSEAGVVNPSVQCPVVIAGTQCNGHEDPGSVLEGWPG